MPRAQGWRLHASRAGAATAAAHRLFILAAPGLPCSGMQALFFLKHAAGDDGGRCAVRRRCTRRTARMPHLRCCVCMWAVRSGPRPEVNAPYRAYQACAISKSTSMLLPRMSAAPCTRQQPRSAPAERAGRIQPVVPILPAGHIWALPRPRQSVGQDAMDVCGRDGLPGVLLSLLVRLRIAGFLRAHALTRARRLLIDTFAAGLVAFVLSMQWRWYISVKRDVKMIKANRLAGVLDRAVLREVDIADFALLGRDKKPEAPKARARSGQWRCARAPRAQQAGSLVPRRWGRMCPSQLRLVPRPAKRLRLSAGSSSTAVLRLAQRRCGGRAACVARARATTLTARGGGAFAELRPAPRRSLWRPRAGSMRRRCWTTPSGA